MSHVRVVASVSALCLVATLAAGQQALESHAGYFALEELALFAPDELEADIDLAGAALALMAGATASEDPQFADLMSNIERISVQVGRVASPDQVSATIADAVANLEARGWSRLLRVKTDGTEEIHMYGMGDAAALSGITIMVFDGEEEAVLLNIVGTLDPQVIGKLMGSVGELDLEQLGVELAAGGATDD
jgi:hypothetical protein